MNRSVFIVILLFLTVMLSQFRVFAQNKTDSLIALLKANPPDSTQVDLYISLHKSLFSEDTTQAMAYLRKAINLSEKIDDKKRICKGYLQLDYYLWRKGSYEDAMQALVEVRKQNDILKDPEIEATYYIERGVVYSLLGDYDKAVKDLFQALTKYEALNDSVGMGKCYTNIGSAYFRLQNIEKALQYYLQGLEVARNIGNKQGEANALGNIALVYRTKRDYAHALEYCQQSLKINQELGALEDARIDLYNIGLLYQQLEKLDSALFYFKNAKELAIKINSKRGILYANHAIAVIEAISGNYILSNKMLDEALELARALAMKEEMKNIYLSYSYNYEETGNFKLALNYRKEFEKWKDSLINKNHLNQIAELETKYETEKKDKQITLLAKEKEIQQKETDRQATLKKAFSVGFLFMCVLSVLLFYIFRQRLRNQKLLAAKNEEIKEANFKRQLSELEMKALRAQINPHFLFNCMNSINRMILEGEPENASRYLSKFSKLVRLILENSETNQVSLENELAMIESYIQLEELRFKEKISYSILVDHEIEPENTFLPPMILQPFVENAIWHGLMHREEKENGKINIIVKEEGDHLFCSIEDNGVGREKAKALRQNSVWKSKSMGMKITEERLRLLSKEKLQELIHITDLKGRDEEALGTRVDINIPVS